MNRRWPSDAAQQLVAVAQRRRQAEWRIIQREAGEALGASGPLPRSVIAGIMHRAGLPGLSTFCIDARDGRPSTIPPAPPTPRVPVSPRPYPQAEPCRVYVDREPERPAQREPMLDALLVVPDSHHPYQDARAWRLMLQVGRALRPRYLVCVGDLLDNYAVSAHSRDPRRRTNLEWEIEAANGALDELDALGAEHRMFCAGNHEYRLDRYLQDKAPELFNMVRLEQLLKLRERGWQVVPYREHGKIGKMAFTHEVGNCGPAAHIKARETMQGNVAIGHTHRLAVHYASNGQGEAHVGAMLGHLLDLSQVDYMHRIQMRHWQLGFGVGYVERETGVVHLQPIPIIDYRCVVAGRAFVA